MEGTISINSIKEEIEFLRKRADELEWCLEVLEAQGLIKPTVIKKAETNNIKTIHDLELKLPTERDQHQYLAGQRWDEGYIVCPRCEGHNHYIFTDGIRYKCKNKDCKYIFTAISNTIMESSKLSLIKWLQAMWTLTRHPNTTSVDIAKQLEITQKTAWHMKEKIKWAFKD